MRKRGAIPPLSKRQHQRNNVVERVCRIEAAPLPAAVVVRLVSPITPTTHIRFPHKTDFVQTSLPLA